MKTIRARVYGGPRTHPGFHSEVNTVLDKAIGPKDWNPVPRWKSQLEEAWYHLLHPFGIHWYITTMVWNREKGVFQTLGDLCWLCPDTLPNLRRLYLD